MSIITAVRIDIWEIVSQLTDDPREMVCFMKAVAGVDPRESGTECALHAAPDEARRISAWLHAFAGALAPAPEGQP